MSKIQFRNAAHRDFVLENLDKCKVNDCYHRAFFYVMGISEETRMNIGKMFDFKRDCIIPEGMHGGWQTSGTVKVCHLAFNLWNGFTEEGRENLYAMPSEGRFHAEYDSERSYSKEELAQMFASVEWQADTMGASLLMPRRIIENALAKYNQSNPIRVYGDNTITSKDKAVIRRMAAYIGVSYTALVIRLRDMGLFEYHNILEYISNELNLGGVSQ